jgi:hypothetical protein
MTNEQMLEALKIVEERHGKTYLANETAALYMKFSWMTSEKWEELCRVVLSESTYFPKVKRFTEVYEKHQSDFKRLVRVRVPCSVCGGDGVRSWLQRLSEGRFQTPVTQCSCPNGENWPGIPPDDEVQSRPDFVRWLVAREPNVCAIARAERGDTWEPRTMAEKHDMTEEEGRAALDAFPRDVRDRVCATQSWAGIVEEPGHQLGD